MFDIDKWQEIFHTIRKNKLRTFITAFNVAWGIFILILLVGFGRGFSNGVENQFRDDATNSIWIWAGQTSKAHKGMKPGRNIQLTNQDFEAVNRINGVEYITARYYLRGEFTVRYKDRYSSFSVRACHPDHQYLEKTIVTKGRYLNQKDLDDKRKVTSIGTEVVKVLFGNEDPIGKYIDINGIPYKVVGVYEDEGGEGEIKIIYIPITTAQTAYGAGNKINQIMFTMGDASLAESITIQNSVDELLRERLIIAEDDERAIRVNNSLEDFMRFQNLFAGIRGFLFFVGICTLIAGVVGISNIMLIVVKERTREIGVRKAIGATPRSVIGLFLMEALLITLASGYIGLVGGIAFIEFDVLSNMMETFGFPMDFFRNPQINIRGAIGATVVLAIAGTLAGYFPARRAAKIRPIEALRDE
ncbi:MAG: ABC transporter permease [Bacteroidota bacterium]